MNTTNDLFSSPIGPDGDGTSPPLNGVNALVTSRQTRIRVIPNINESAWTTIYDADISYQWAEKKTVHREYLFGFIPLFWKNNSTEWSKTNLNTKKNKTNKMKIINVKSGKLLLIFLLININSMAQNSAYYLGEPLISKRVIILGETHWVSEITSSIQLNIINELIKNGHKKIFIGIEYPPSSVFKLHMFLKTGDSNFLKRFKEDNNWYHLLFDLYKLSDSITFNLISLEPEHKINRDDYYEFISFIESHINSSTKLKFDAFFKAKREVKIKREVRKMINDSVLMKATMKNLGEVVHDLFWLELRVINENGFIKFGRSRKMIRLRELNHVREINKVFADTASVLLVTLGGVHVSNYANLSKSLLFNQNNMLSELSRNDVGLIDIMYFDDDVIRFNSIYYGNYFKKKILELEKLKVFDKIIKVD